MEECLTGDRRAAGLSLTSVTALCPSASLVLVQPRKACPYITERLLLGHNESNQTSKQNWDVVFIMLINVKMPAIVGILALIYVQNKF